MQILAYSQAALFGRLFVLEYSMPIYECYVDYDVLASYSLEALKGYATGWCSPVRISQTPLIYDLYIGRYEKNPDVNPGELFGQFELRRRPGGESEIIFHDKTHLLQYNREWTDEEKEGGASLEGDEQLKYVMQIQKKMWGEKENRQAELRVHLKKVIEVYFHRLDDWDIKPYTKAKPEEPPKSPEPPSRKKMLDQACIEWVNREKEGRLGRYTRQDFLDEFEEKTGSYISIDIFRRALEDAQKRGLIENVKGRLRQKTRP